MTLKEQLQQKIDLKTKPVGSLGMLEKIALQVGLIQATLVPALQRPVMLVFAADHGLTNEGISPYPKDVTWQMVMNFCLGGAAINIFCRQNDIELKVIDAGVDYEFPVNLPVISAKVRQNGSRNMLHEPAMTAEECHTAVERGAAFVKKEADAGTNIIGFGEMGIGNTSASSLLMAAFTGIPVEDCIGRGTGADGEVFAHKIKVLKEVFAKYDPQGPEKILATFGGLEIAMMVGAVLEAVRLDMVIMVDGFIATAAVLTASKLTASVIDHCIFCHASDEKGHRQMLDYLHAKPLLHLGMRLGEGSGAAVAYPLICSAVAFLNDMSSFKEAGVSQEK